MVGEDFAFEVVDFVLCHTCKHAVDFFFVDLPLLVVPAQTDAFVTENVFVDVGDAEATFVEVLFFAYELKDFGVDECVFFSGFEVGVGFLVVGTEANDNKLDAEVDLGCGKAYTVGIVHGFVHVGDELVKAGIVFVDGLRLFAQCGMAVANNGIEHFSV